MSRKKIARRVTMRVARNLTKDFFNDPIHSMMYEQGKNIWRDEQARLQAERDEIDDFHESIQDLHPGLDELSRPASHEVMPQGNVNVAQAVEWVTVPTSYLDASGKPVALRAPRMKDNRPEHVYMDNWMALTTYNLQVTTPEGVRSHRLAFGYTNDDIETRVLGYKDRRITKFEAPEGFPPIGASWQEVLSWVGDDPETGTERAIWVGQRDTGHLPPYKHMTDEQKHLVDSYNPWKTALSYLDRYALTPNPTDQEHFQEHLAEFYNDDHWH